MALTANLSCGSACVLVAVQPEATTPHVTQPHVTIGGGSLQGQEGAIYPLYMVGGKWVVGGRVVYIVCVQDGTVFLLRTGGCHAYIGGCRVMLVLGGCDISFLHVGAAMHHAWEAAMYRLCNGG